MPQNQNRRDDSAASWAVVIVMLFVFWPVGLYLLCVKLIRMAPRAPSAAPARRVVDTTARPAARPAVSPAVPQPSAAKSAAKPNAKDPLANWGRGLIAAGAAVCAVFGLALLSTLGGILASGAFWSSLTKLIALTGLTALGAALIVCGSARRKKVRRCRKYLALIGSQKELSVDSLAAAMPVPYRRACADLQDMFDLGLLPAGYLDGGKRRLILTPGGIREEAPAPETGSDEAILAEIRAINDAIPDETMSRKIDRIGEITGKIFEFQRANPGSAGELRSFLDYYLPTTLKILRAYAQLDAQGVSGGNIGEAKAKIEGMMDKLVEGYENRLDRLYRSDALDITSDVAVMEQMLARDGLAGDELRVPKE